MPNPLAYSLSFLSRGLHIELAPPPLYFISKQSDSLVSMVCDQIVRYLEGELSAEDLNGGMAPGQSAMHRSGGGNTDEVRRLRRMAFGPGTGTAGGTISEYASSEMSAPTSEYGLNPSSEYTHRAGTGRGAAEGASGEAGRGTTEGFSRRTTGRRTSRG